MPFSQESLDFLTDNYFFNSREWYRAHREDYLRLVQEPMAELVSALAPKMLSVDPEFITAPKTGKTISRIYRDIRRVRDGMLFHRNVWCAFSRDKKQYPEGAPAFYFQIGADGFDYGCGFYAAGAGQMERMRELIFKQDPRFLRALRAYEKQDVFTMTGESYKRNRFPDQPARFQNFLNRKYFFFEKQSQDFDRLFSEQLPDLLWRDFEQIAPIYDFLLAFA